MMADVVNDDNSKFDDMSNSIQIESLFLPCVLLDTFFSPEFISQAETLDTKFEKRLIKEGIRQGFKLLVVYTLDSYIDAVIRNPEGLGLEPDLDYRDYWAFTMGRGREISRTIARGDHEISRFVAKANSIISEVMTLNTWEDIENFGEKTKGFRDCLHNIYEETYEATKDSEIVSIKEALLEVANSKLWATSLNTKPIAHKYTDYFISQRNDASLSSFDEQVAESPSRSGLTRLDEGPVSRAFIPRPIPSHWALGYVFTVHESLKLLKRNDMQFRRLAALDTIVHNTKDWKDVRLYDRKITDVYGLPRFFSGYSYRPLSTITDEQRIPLIGESGTSISPERLLAIFGNRARIVERGFPGAVNSFECLLDGAIKRSKKTKEKAKVAIIVHKNKWEQEDYSVAVFMPAYGFFFTNASMWWVFYSIGYGDSGGSSQGWRQVLKKIKRNENSIELTTENADKDEFYRYCEDPGYTRLKDDIALTNRITGDIRGAFPELMLANMLTNMGCTGVRIGFRPSILKQLKGELDVLGIKHDADSPKLLLFESKGQATVDQDLQKEINLFSARILIIQKNLESFCNELGFPFSLATKVEAVFVSMGMVNINKAMQKPKKRTILSSGGPSISVPDNVAFWDFNELVAQFKQAKIPRKYIELLKMTQVAVLI